MCASTCGRRGGRACVRLCVLLNSEYQVYQLFTKSRVSDPKSPSSVCPVRLEVNEQFIPTGCDVSRQIAATECVDQWSCGVSAVVNVHFVTTAVSAVGEREADEVQTHTL